MDRTRGTCELCSEDKQRDRHCWADLLGGQVAWLSAGSYLLTVHSFKDSECEKDET